jgi:hypothetical protein
MVRLVVVEIVLCLAAKLNFSDGKTGVKCRMKLYHERPEGHVRLFSILLLMEKLFSFFRRTYHTLNCISVLSPNNLIWMLINKYHLVTLGNYNLKSVRNHSHLASFHLHFLLFRQIQIRIPKITFLTFKIWV